MVPTVRPTQRPAHGGRRFRTFSWVLPAALTVMAVTASQAAAPNYSRIILGTLGGNNSAAASINASGQVTGTTQTANGEDAAFLFKDLDADSSFDAGEMVNLTPGEVGIGTDLNDYGQVSGTLQTPTSSHAFLWTPSAANQLLGNKVEIAPDSPDSGANGINAFGQVVGTMLTENGRVAFLWTPPSLHDNGANGGTLTELPSLGGSYSEALDINERGQVVGISLNENGVLRPFLWSPDTANGTTGSLVELDNIPAGLQAGATSLNNSGRVTGYVDYEGTLSAYMWTPTTANGATGTYADLGRPTQNGFSNGLSINNNNEVVGVATHSNGQVLGVFRDTSGFTFFNNVISPTDVGFYFPAKILDDRRVVGIGAVAVGGGVRSRAVILVPQGANAANAQVTFEAGAPVGSVNPGQQVNIPVRLENLGPANATNFKVVFKLTKMTGVSMDPGSGPLPVSGQEFGINYTSFHAGRVQVINVKATVQPGSTGTAGFTATVTLDQNDPASSNNSISRNFGITQPQPPAKPANFTATVASPTSVNLSWGDVSNETGYEIYRKKLPSTSLTLIGNLGANVTSYTDTGLTPKTEYQYRIRAKNAAGNSSYTTSAVVKTPAGLASSIVVTPGKVEFGEVKVNTERVLLVKFKNTANVATTATLSVGAPFNFLPGTPTSLSLGPLGEATVNIRIKPTKQADFKEQLTVLQTDREVLKVPVTASAVKKIGVLKVTIVEPAPRPGGERAMEWGDRSLSAGVQLGGIKIENTGNAPLFVEVPDPASVGGSNASAFAVVLAANKRKLELNPGKSRGVVITFTPAEARNYVALLNLKNLNTNEVVTLGLYGNGVSP